MNWYEMSKEEVVKSLKTNSAYGLTNKAVEVRQDQFGKNKLQEAKKENLIIRFLKQFNDFMILTLIVAAIVSAGISYIQGSNEYMDAFIIIAIVVFNSIMGLIQEYKAEKSIESLKKMSASKAKVKREGRISIIEAEDIVPGDIVILETGNFVPADCRLLESFYLKAEEASLTGETIPVEKDILPITNQKLAMGDMLNMVFSSTTIVAGHGIGVVTEIGMQTKVGHIATMINTDTSPETPLQKRLSDVGKKLGMVALLMCFAIFLIGIFKKIPVIQMFMTSIGLAVAAIPEGLPAVVTIMLSIGVTKMAKKHAIIRKLPAVETLRKQSSDLF